MARKKILVVVDPTTDDEHPVVLRAAWLAERVGAALELFACDYDPEIDAGRVGTVWIPEAGTREHLLLLHRRRLEDLAAPLRERGLEVTVHVTWDYAKFVETHPVEQEHVHVLKGLPHECIQYAVQHQRADFLVMGAIARRGIKKLLIGSTAARVLDRVACDLVIVKPANLFLPERDG